MLPVLRRTLRSLLKVLRHNRKVFVLTFIQRSAQHSLTALSDELTKLNPRVAFAQTYPDEIQGAFDCASDALEFSRLAVEAARTGAPARGIAVSAHNRAIADMASGLTRLLYRVCADRTEAEWRVVDLLVPGVRGQQRAVAQALGITTQAVSRTLMRSLWHEEQAARPAVLDLLNRLDTPSPPAI